MTSRRIKFGLAVGEYSPPFEGVHAGIVAESYGFDSAWAHDEAVSLGLGGEDNPSEQWSTSIALGVLTKRMTVGPAVTDCFRIHPSKIAQLVAAMDDLTYGRAILGLGAGEVVNTTPYGIGWMDAEARLVMLRECIDVIKKLWTEGTSASGVTYNGKFFTLKEARMLTRFLTKPHPPIYIGALGNKKLLELTGELAEGWFPWQTSPSVWARRLSVILEAAKKANRDPESIDRVAYVTPYVGEDQVTLELAKRGLKYDLLVERYTLKELGFKIPTPKEYNVQDVEFSRKQVQEITNVIDSVSDDFMLKNHLLPHGSVDDVIGVVERYVDAGASHVVVADPLRNAVGTSSLLKVFGEKIIPYFRNR